MLQAMREEPPLAAKCRDKFLIQSTIITWEKQTMPLQDIVSAFSRNLLVLQLSTASRVVERYGWR
jgi:hypothetical protein